MDVLFMNYVKYNRGRSKLKNHYILIQMEYYQEKITHYFS